MVDCVGLMHGEKWLYGKYGSHKHLLILFANALLSEFVFWCICNMSMLERFANICIQKKKEITVCLIILSTIFFFCCCYSTCHRHSGDISIVVKPKMEPASERDTVHRSMYLEPAHPHHTQYTEDYLATEV